MSSSAAQFKYTEMIPGLGESSRKPYVPILLTWQEKTLLVHGLVDSGAATNVLPFDLGKQLGLDWNSQKVPIKLTGNLAQFDARAVLLTATVHDFSPVLLAFAWTQMPGVPLILGQVNFFSEFDICFFRSRGEFELRPATTAGS